MPHIYIEVFRGGDGYRVRQRYSNGNILSTSEAYASRWNARRMAKQLAKLTGFEVREVLAP